MSRELFSDLVGNGSEGIGTTTTAGIHDLSHFDYVALWQNLRIRLRLNRFYTFGWESAGQTLSVFARVFHNPSGVFIGRQGKVSEKNGEDSTGRELMVL